MRAADRYPPSGATATAPAGGGGLFVVFAVILALPATMALAAGGVLLTPVRLFLLAVFVPTTLRILKGALGPVRTFDVMMVLYGAWTALCILKNNGLGGIEGAGQFLLETTVLYLAVQVFMTRVEHLRAFVNAVLVCVLVLAPLAAIESIVIRDPFVLDYTSRLFGWGPYEIRRSDERFGLFRSFVTFRHPILYGTFVASILAFSWYSTASAGMRVAYALLLLFATFFSLSSAPLMIFMVQVMLICIEMASRGMRNRARIIGGGALAFLIFLQLATDAGISGFFAHYIAFNPATTWYRAAIWDHAIDDVLRSPIFGINPLYWTRPGWMASNSIDNFYLVQGMQGGLPSLLFLFVAIVAIVGRVFQEPDAQVSPLTARLRRGWAFTMLALLICATTVHYYDKIQPYFTMMIAIGAALTRMVDREVAEGTAPAAPAPADPGRRRPIIGALPVPGAAAGRSLAPAAPHAAPHVAPSWGRPSPFGGAQRPGLTGREQGA